MSFADEVIEKAVKEGYTFLVLEPKEAFAPAVMEFSEQHKRLVYNIDILLSCFSEEYGWDPIESLEWFDYNVFSLTHMEGGPLFFDEFEGKILTVED
jgi:hypothetical protein